MTTLKTPKTRHIPSGTNFTRESLLRDFKEGASTLPGETVVMVDPSLLSDGKHFALRVIGDGMMLAGINDGDILVVRLQPLAESGDIVVVELENSVFIRRLEYTSGNIRLLPANQKYDPIEIDPLEDESFRIIGKVVTAFGKPHGGD